MSSSYDNRGVTPPHAHRGDDEQKQNKRKLPPDHGSNYVPGAGDANQAPQSMDHFRRGRRERTEMRRREVYCPNENPRRQEEDSPRKNPRQEEHQSLRTDRPPSLKGIDLNRFMDDLCNQRLNVFKSLDSARQEYWELFHSGKVMTAVIAAAARRRQVRLAQQCWEWMDRVGMEKNVYHYNSMISVMEKDKNFREAMNLLKEMESRNIPKNEVTFSSTISACEKCGNWRAAIDLLDRMEREGVGRTAIAYNATISACEKGLVPLKACEVFQRMKKGGIQPSVVSFSALISAAEKGGQWKLALEILEDMERSGFRYNVVAYSACISALAKGQQWERALDLFRQIQAAGGSLSIITFNATMAALEKGMQWERALGLFEEMKMRNLPITVVSYGSALSACDKGLQYRQCLEYLDEMTDIGIPKNVIIFGAALSCMEKCCRADISFQLMERMKLEGITPNVHIYNSVISACARCNLWAKGHDLFREMDEVNVARDVVTYNAVLDAVASQIQLGRTLFEEGIKKGFYARVSRLGSQWFELDLHFLSLGGGEIALGWWFEECMVPYMKNTEKLQDITAISIVTGYGKTRTRGRRHGDDGMKKRVLAMLRFMNIFELPQKNAGRICIDKDRLIEEVNRNGGKIIFDLASYVAWKEKETTANVIPDEPQKIRARFKPQAPRSGRPPFSRVESESTSMEYRLETMRHNGNDVNFSVALPLVVCRRGNDGKVERLDGHYERKISGEHHGIGCVEDNDARLSPKTDRFLEPKGYRRGDGSVPSVRFSESRKGNLVRKGASDHRPKGRYSDSRGEPREIGFSTLLSADVCRSVGTIDRGPRGSPEAARGGGYELENRSSYAHSGHPQRNDELNRPRGWNHDFSGDRRSPYSSSRHRHAGVPHQAIFHHNEPSNRDGGLVSSQRVTEERRPLNRGYCLHSK